MKLWGLARQDKIHRASCQENDTSNVEIEDNDTSDIDNDKEFLAFYNA